MSPGLSWLRLGQNKNVKRITLPPAGGIEFDRQEEDDLMKYPNGLHCGKFRMQHFLVSDSN